MRTGPVRSSSVSPGLTSLLGFAATPLTWTRPDLTASAASARVFDSRAAHSHLSIRIGSSMRSCFHAVTLELDTPHGPARVHLHPAEAPRGALVLGHGAGGGVAAPDL